MRGHLFCRSFKMTDGLNDGGPNEENNVTQELPTPPPNTENPTHREILIRKSLSEFGSRFYVTIQTGSDMCFVVEIPSEKFMGQHVSSCVEGHCVQDEKICFRKQISCCQRIHPPLCVIALRHRRSPIEIHNYGSTKFTAPSRVNRVNQFDLWG